MVTDFLTPDEVWDKTYPKESVSELVSTWRDTFSSIPFENKSGTWQPYYYQEIAIRNTLQEIAQGKDRILLTLATGTGKTAIAFQIAWVLFHTRWNLSVIENEGSNYCSRQPRILFLADRNTLADQAFNAFSEFSAFAEDAMIRIKPNKIKKTGKVPTNGSIFFTIFQSFMSGGSTSSPTENSCQEVEVTVHDKAGYMYILECADGSFYTGSTKNIKYRLKEHQNGIGAEHTKLHSPVKLVYYEVFDRIDEAFARENQVQKWSRAKKIDLINNDIELLKQLSTSKNKPKVPEQFGELTEPVAEGNFGQYPADFFDFIIIDECHRGGANDEGNWRGILDYFSPAVQLGLTATPKRKDNVDTYKYFGEPVYIYSLKEGINDGFLTPFKVQRITTTLDDYMYISDDEVIAGEVEKGKIYQETDFNREIEIKEREAKRVQIFMDAANENDKTIIFCANQAHAALVRDLVNQYASTGSATGATGSATGANRLVNSPNYCVRVTANDGKIGEQFLCEFRDNENSLPTVLTTSQKLSTGVDARNIRNIVLLRPVNQIIEFKQIIGRGTRLFDGKEFFTIYDFVNAYERFADPEWDGEPEYDMGEFNEKGVIHEEYDDVVDDDTHKTTEKAQKIKIKLADGKEREIQHIMATSFWDAGGKPISAEEFLHSLFGELPNFFNSEEELRILWSQPKTRKTLLEKLDEAGFGKAELIKLQELIDAEKSDLFDVLEYVFNSDIKPITRKARVVAAESTIYALLDEQQQEFINFVLGKYIESGVDELALEKLPSLLKIKYQSLKEATERLGENENIKSLFIEFQQYLYLQEAA